MSKSENKLSALSMSRLNTVVKPLQDIMLIAISEANEQGMTVQITEGLRSKYKQKQLFQEGKTQTMNSYHLSGKAVDVYVNNGWDFSDYQKFADIVKKVAKDNNINVTWGGDWKTLKDGPHFQIEC